MQIHLSQPFARKHRIFLMKPALMGSQRSIAESEYILFEMIRDTKFDSFQVLQCHATSNKYLDKCFFKS